MRALNRFHHCSMTKMVKKMVNSCRSTPAMRSKYHSRANIIRKNTPPIHRMPRSIGRVMMKASLLRGFSPNTSRDGGNEASAMAAKVSMIMLTHSIWVMVSGISVPISEPPSTSSKAVMLTVSWKKTKRWIFL